MSAETERKHCSICLNNFQQPKIIDCQHSFCFTCLKDYIRKTKIPGHFPCPLCACDITIPEDGVNYFPNDLSHGDDDSTTDIQLCDVCKTDCREFKCRDCNQYLCEFCRTLHDILTVCRDHVVENCPDDMSPEKASPSAPTSNDFCPNHNLYKKQKRAKFYCSDCSLAVCSRCFVTFHNGHQFSPLQDICKRDQIRDQIVN